MQASASLQERLGMVRWVGSGQACELRQPRGPPSFDVGIRALSSWSMSSCQLRRGVCQRRRKAQASGLHADEAAGVQLPSPSQQECRAGTMGPPRN